MATGATLLADVRTLTHDSGVGFSNDDPYYLDAEVIDSLTMARQMLVRMLLSSPQIPLLTLSSLSKTAVSPSGSNVPTDFYRLICGYMNDGSYVPAKSILIGEAMKDSSAQQVYVRGGKFYGTADNVLYWAMPSQGIVNDNTTLNEFGDSFYNIVKYQACLYLLMKEDADAKDRFVQLTTEMKRKLGSLS
jgi:hypothetical protein